MNETFQSLKFFQVNRAFNKVPFSNILLKFPSQTQEATTLLHKSRL